MTSRRQCPRGVGGACEIPPSGNPVSAPVICVKFWAINPSAPLTKAFPYAYGLPPHINNQHKRCSSHMYDEPFGTYAKSHNSFITVVG